MAAKATRQARVRKIAALRSQGLSSPEIGRRIGIAPSTVREYERDPTGAKRRARQLRYAVDPPVALNGGEVVGLRPSSKFTPHKGKGLTHNAARNRQVRAIIGWGKRKG